MKPRLLMDILTSAVMGLFVWTSLVGTPAGAAERPALASYPVAMTGYNAVPEQTDEDPSTTASGAYSNPEVVAARSVDLADELPFGTVIEIVPKESAGKNCGLSLVQDHVGLRVIADSMHPRKRNQIDLLFDTATSVKVGGKKTNAALALGVCKDVEINVVGKIDVNDMPRSQAELRRVVDKQILAIEK